MSFRKSLVLAIAISVAACSSLGLAQSTKTAAAESFAPLESSAPLDVHAILLRLRASLRPRGWQLPHCRGMRAEMIADLLHS